MSVQFTITWDNTEIAATTNALSQLVVYRQKAIGGAYLSAGFTPSNPLAKSVSGALSPVLDDNKIYQFKQQTICTANSPSENDNGVQESISLVCLLPTITQTTTQTTATLDVTGLDITKAKFLLKKQSDNSNASSPFTVNRVGNSIQATATGLTTATAYYWQINLYSVVNGLEVISDTCTPYNVTTN